MLQFLGNRQNDPKVRERVIWALQVHYTDLLSINEAKKAFSNVLDEPLTQENRMLRYNCAYMLGMIWEADAPAKTLDILHDFLRDPDIKIYVGTSASAGVVKIEGPAGTAKVKDDGMGDGRTMATDALAKMGKARYGNRADIIERTAHPFQRFQVRPLARQSGQLAQIETLRSKWQKNKKRRVRQAYSRGRTLRLQLRGASARVRLTHPTSTSFFFGAVVCFYPFANPYLSITSGVNELSADLSRRSGCFPQIFRRGSKPWLAR